MIYTKGLVEIMVGVDKTVSFSFFLDTEKAFMFWPFLQLDWQQGQYVVSRSNECLFWAEVKRGPEWPWGSLFPHGI